MKRFAAGAVQCFAVFCFLAGASAALAAVNMQEGQWEMTIKVKLEGLPFSMPAMTARSTQCITKKNLVPNTSNKNQKCTISEQKEAGDKVTWTVKCTEKDGSSSMGVGTITYSGNALQGTIKTTSNDKNGKATSTSTTDLSGKRKGDCPK